MQGELSEKMIEIINQKIQIFMMMQKYDEVLAFITKRNELSQQIYGLESEQYCEMLEEEVIFNFQMNRPQESLALM